MRKIIFIVLFFVGNFIIAQTNPKRLALVIGNAAYINGGVLKNAVNDANLMANTLQNLGFEVEKLTNANLKQMQEATIRFTNKITNYDVALFYYAGHGVQVNGVNFLVPVDAKMDNELTAKYEAFDISDINYAFAQNHKNMNIMILDACRDNPFRSWMRGGNRGFKAIGNQSAGTIIAFATREGETASDGSGNNGLYTEKLVQEMKKPQDINSVFKNTRIAVLAASSNKQCPQEWDMTTGQFSFIENNQTTNNTHHQIEEPVLNPGNVTVFYGSITIDTEISGDLYIDGKKIGYLNANTTGNKLNKIIAGTHTVEIKGNENFSQTINIEKDLNINLSIKSKNSNNNTKFEENIISGNEHEYMYETFTDPRDNKKYKIVTIGEQLWMAENLAYKPKNGNFWIYENNQSNLEKYGYLYDWQTACKVCPDGWHLPTKTEWEQLLEFITSQQKEKIGKSLKSKKGWDKGIYPNAGGNGTDNYHFNGLPAGLWGDNGGCHDLGETAEWWSSTPQQNDNRNAFRLYLSRYTDAYSGDWRRKKGGISVRCIKD